MNNGLRILAILLIFTGVIWILQGINLLPGSFMTGQIEWAVYGSITIVIGLALIFFARRSKR